MRKLRLIGIPITNRCDANCLFCNRKEYINKNILNPTLDLSMDKIGLLIKRINGKVEYINISAGYGESLLHPEIDNILKMLFDVNLRTIVYTNGRNIHKCNINLIDKLVVSVNKDTYTDYVERFLQTLDTRNRHRIRLSLIIDYAGNDYNFFKRIIQLAVEYNVCLECNLCNTPNNLLKIQHSNYIKRLEYVKNLHENQKIYIPSNNFHRYCNCYSWKDSLYFTIEGYLRRCCIYLDTNNDYNIFNDDLMDIINSDFVQLQLDCLKKGREHIAQCATCTLGHGNARVI